MQFCHNFSVKTISVKTILSKPSLSKHLCQKQLISVKNIFVTNQLIFVKKLCPKSNLSLSKLLCHYVSKYLHLCSKHCIKKQTFNARDINYFSMRLHSISSSSQHNTNHIYFQCITSTSFQCSR